MELRNKDFKGGQILHPNSDDVLSNQESFQAVIACIAKSACLQHHFPVTSENFKRVKINKLQIFST